MAKAEDYFDDVKKHAGECNEAVVAKIVRHLGIALQSKDASLVSASDPAELERVREKWLKKKLALTDSDEALDGAIASVMTTLKGVNQKQRVTVYYLLAKHFNKFDDLLA